MASYGIPDDPALRTTSRLRAWYLQSVWGYRVLEVRRKPRQGWFGSLAFDEAYVLLPKHSREQ